VSGFLATAGLAFAMQEVIGALAGWVSILTGRHCRVGDRIQMGGVHGDVLDLSPLRTKILEIGRAEVEPRVFVRATDNWIELAARFIVPVPNARAVKDEMTRCVLDRCAEEPITVASATQAITIRRPPPGE
jgi:small-conductance mechanosensitive channel